MFFTIGAARSGKSTYSKKWLNYPETIMPDLKGPRAVWNTDSLRLAAHGERYSKEFEPLAFGIKQVVIKALLDNHHVLVDGTHSSEESIKRLLETNIDAQPLLFDTDEEECIRRARASNQDDLVECGVIRRHCRQIEDLKKRGLDKVINKLRTEIIGRRTGN